MFERFSDRARKTLALANQEAQRFNHECIGPEHILLGLVKEGSNDAAAVLKNVGVDLRKVRIEVEKLLKSGPEMVTVGKLPLTSSAQNVIEYAIEEARNHDQKLVETEHLLLGLLREKHGLQQQVLKNLGVNMQDARKSVMDLLYDAVPPEGPPQSSALSYEKSGVSIDTADAAKKQMADTMATQDPRILHRKNAFASLFDASFPGIKEPVLVMKTEEPGSKQKIAFAHNRPRSIAYDMIHHLIDDILVVGAQPLAVQDCIVCGKLQKDVVLQLVAAINDACRNNDCFLIGGETSEQPGVLAEGTYILSSSIVGVVEKSRIIDGQKIQLGDTVLAVPSNGLHTNGYSLVRALITQHPDIYHETIINEHGESENFLDAILKPHTCYYQPFKGLFTNPELHGIAHITGGGIVGNLNRILPENKNALIDAAKLRILPLFKRIQQLGQVPESDMLKTFNLGIGMTLVCTPAAAPAIIQHLAAFNLAAYPIGEIVEGNSAVIYQGQIHW